MECVVCGKLGTKLWTIDSGEMVAVLELCNEHGRPLMELLALGDEPPARGEEDELLSAPRRQERKRPVKPLQWTPPTPPPIRKDALPVEKKAVQADQVQMIEVS